TRANRDKVPSEWIRKQTLTTGERYTTQELRTYEEKVLDAQQKIEELENTLYQAVLRECCTYIKRIQNTVQSLSYMDVINSFARVSSEYNYHRPVLEDSYDFEIVQGRHPVIERNMESGKEYVPNDIRFSKDGCHIMMITGPNMSGKSAVLRQTALIVLLAQAGCFVPAVSARIGLVDKIFTRVGASDNIASGESTFMVEMNETANIINNLTERSLVLLDEIGRGTSTYDGISIARAIAEYLHEAPGKGCKVLFATHYHELNQMAARYPHIRNFHVKVKEVDDRVIFLRTLEEGGSEHSFGIHVAEMAGMPKYVVRRAREILEMLEETRENGANVAGQGAASEALSKSPAVKKASQEGIEGVETTEKETHKPYQLSFIQLDDPLLEKIRDEILDLDLDKLTPIQALNKLDEIKKLLRRKK
ncbi:MAG: DNA mismatch repair protein MutS, partial [Bacteroidales bacterium]|nr:DNA mismatch repair protein MutS [Bacteroidales bacterium]